MKNISLNESSIDISKLYFHGSAKPKMTQADKPSFEHPFYVTSDAEYAMAFATKRHSSTGHQTGSIEFAKTQDNNYVYVVSLNKDANFIDIRKFGTPEFDEFLSLLPKHIVELLDRRSEKNYTKDKALSHYSSTTNDVWYIFDIIRNTVVTCLESDCNSKLFRQDYYLEKAGKKTDYEYKMASSIADSIENPVHAAYAKLYAQADRAQQAMDRWGNVELAKVYKYAYTIRTDTELYQQTRKLLELKYRKQDTTQQAYLIALAIYKIFLELKDKQKKKEFNSSIQISSIISKFIGYARMLVFKGMSDKAFSKMPNEEKRNLNVRKTMVSELLNKSNAPSLYQNPYAITAEDIKKLDDAIQSDEILSKIADSNVTTHQIMNDYFKKLYNKGYVGVITGEHDTNEQTGMGVDTANAIGIWDKSGLSSCILLPIKYKWLKTIEQKCKTTKTSTIEEKIQLYVNTYNRLFANKKI